MASTPNDSWFYLAGQRPVGPMSAEQMRAAVTDGAVHPETMVRRAAWPHWCPAGQLPELFPGQATGPAAHPLPPRAVPPRCSPPSHVPPPVRQPALEVGTRTAAKDWRKRTAHALRKRRYAPLAVLGALLGMVVLTVSFLLIRARSTPPPTPVTELRVQLPKQPAARPPRRMPPTEDLADAALRAPDLESAAVVAAAPNWRIFETSAPPTPRSQLDELVFAKWKELGIEPANLCSDAVFLRRVFLDVVGTLPTIQEARTFLSDSSPDKRAQLIDALLARPEFADYWAMKWSDLLRVKSEFPVNLWPNAAQAYHRWIRNSIRDNLPYDKFVRELLTSSGSNFRAPQVNFYRALQAKDPPGIARAVALNFMGCRADRWEPDRLTGVSAFFFQVGYKRTGEWKEEIVFFDPDKTGAPAPVLPDGTAVQIGFHQDPRDVFADWLIKPENPWFTRSIVNRVWYWLQGRGIVHEADDLRPDNPPSNPELLDWLAQELVTSHYDLKHIYRLILNSSTYQLSSIAKSKHPETAVQFAAYTVRRLEAEVIIDALNQITGTSESYSSIIPEPYTFIPETRRAIALPDGSISSSFLELFGRSARDSGLESERNNRITAGQRLHLLNSSHIRNKLREGPALQQLLAEKDVAENLYLAILSRPPADEERVGKDDLAWTLINTTEFLFRH